MYKPETKRVARVAASAIISVALAVGSAGVAFADGPYHGRAHDGHTNEGRHLGISGVVRAIGTTDPMTITVQGRDGGALVTYPTSTTTSYFLDEAPASAAALAVGDRVKLQLSNTTPETVLKVSIKVPSFEGTVLALTSTTAPTTLSITGHDGSPSRTVDVTASTTFMEGGAPATLANILVGSEIRAIGTTDTTGVLTASTIVIQAPEMFNAGTVTLVTLASGTAPMTFTVQGRDGGAAVEYTTSAATTYFIDKSVTTSASLVAGDRVKLLLSATTPQTVVTVAIKVPSFEGKVLTAPTLTTPPTFTITSGDHGTARIVDVTSSTTFVQGGAASSLNSVVVGSEVKVTGTVDPLTHAITAFVVKISGGHSHH